MRDFSHATVYRKPGRPRRRGRMLPALLLLLSTLLVLVLAFLVFRSLGLFAPKAAPGVRAVELDTASEAILTAASGKSPAAPVREAIGEMLDQVEAMDGDTLLWTGRDAEGNALFRVKSKDGLTFAPGIAEKDTLFSRCDPARELAVAAQKRGMALLLLPTSESGEVLTADRLSETCPDVLAAAKKYGLQLAAPEAQPDAGLTLYRVFDSRLADTGLSFARSDESPARLFTLLDADASSRIILGRSSTLFSDPSVAILLARHALSGEEAAEALPDLLAVMGGRSISQELALAYPSTAVYTDTCFLMGTSDPARPLSIHGGTVGEKPVTVERYGTQGVWGMLVSLSEGENAFTLTQEGGETLSFTVERRQYTSSGGSEVTASDGTVPAVWGQQVRVTGAACVSALSDYTNADTITATLYQGATVAVYDSVRSLRAGKKTYYYQLANGSYIPAWAVELLDVDTPAPVFDGMEVGFDQDTNCTTITLRGGTPAVTHQWEGNALALTFLTAQYQGDIPVPDRFVTEYSAENAADGLSFTLGLRFAADDSLYGWSVSYDTEANTTTVYLKHRPSLSGADTGPLTGVRVLLDAGHGGDDNGAMGSAGLSAPLEKDVNLAEALAARHRLEELGATVLLVREDDTFFTLDERLNMVRDLRPDIFIALHHNSAALVSDINNSGGTEAYWFYTEGKPLAERLVSGICSATGRARRGAFYNYYYVTRSNICPSVLLESGFMTDPAEYETCADPATLWDEAGAIALSVLDYISALG